MKIQYLKISQFAGIQSFESSFEGNLNVIFGVNEAGKSSIMKALKFALFVPSSANSKQLNSTLGFKIDDFLPRGGSDSFSIELKIESEGTIFQLKKTFGAVTSSELLNLNSGVRMIDPLQVQARINQILGIDNDTGKMNLAVWLDILFANQASLSKTIAEINEKQELTNSLSDLLNRLEGISPEELKARISKRVEELGGKWEFFDENNLVLNRPYINPATGQGGIEHRWINNTGEIIQAYYAFKDAGIEKNARQLFEAEFDNIVAQINEKQGELTHSRAFLELHEPYLNAHNQRENFINLEQRLTQQIGQHQEDLTRWITFEAAVGNFPAELELSSNALNNLNVEIEQAILFQNALELRQLVNQLQDLDRQIAQKTNEILETRSISLDHFNQARNFHEALRELNIQIEAQKLGVKLIAKKSVVGVQQSGIDAEVSFSLDSNQELVVTANTQFVVETDEMRLEVTAGIDDVSLLHKQFQTNMDGLQVILQHYGLEEYSLFQMDYMNFTRLNEERSQLENRKSDLLAGRNFEDLLNQLAVVNDIQVRPQAVLQNLIDQQRIQIIQMQNLNNERQITLTRFKEKYASQQALMNTMTSINSNLVDVQRQLAALPTLVEGFENHEDFDRQYADMQRIYDVATESLNRLQVARAEKISRYTEEESLQEIEEREHILEQKFNDLLEKGHAFLKIQKKLDDILNALGDNPFGDLAIKVNHYLELLTDGKYTQTRMNGITPKGIFKSDVLLDNKLLSQGTADTLALATRLAMADYYLDGDNGLFLLDDPFTELDDIRKERASYVLGQFAQDKQVFVFTCHNNHKEMLGGNLVELA